MKRAFALSVLLVAAGAPAMAELVNDYADLKPIVCASGEAASFAMEPASALPDDKAVERVLPGVRESRATRGDMNFRLDVCVTDDKVELKRVVSHLWSMEVAQSFTPENTDKFIVSGLKDAVFGDVAALKIDIKDKADEGGLAIRGLEGSMVAAVGILWTNGTWKPASLRALVGNLVSGDPFSNAKCKAGQEFKTSEIQIDSAKFAFEFCAYMGGGETTGYDIIKLAMSDSSTEVPAGARGKTIALEGERLKQQLNIQWNHHNACDSFVLTVPDLKAKYAATAAPMAGCGNAVPGAPDRNFDDSRNMLYRFDYNGKTGELKEHKDAHFLRLW